MQEQGSIYLPAMWYSVRFSGRTSSFLCRSIFSLKTSGRTNFTIKSHTRTLWSNVCMRQVSWVRWRWNLSFWRICRWGIRLFVTPSQEINFITNFSKAKREVRDCKISTLISTTLFKSSYFGASRLHYCFICSTIHAEKSSIKSIVTASPSCSMIPSNYVPNFGSLWSCFWILGFSS